MGKFEEDLKKVRLEEKFITEKMNNTPKSVEEFRRGLDEI